MKNYYEILEVDKNASLDTIKKIYKYKIKLNHPDLFQGEEKIKAEQITQELTEAYDIISNPDKRKEYDKNIDSINNENDILIKENDILKAEIKFLTETIEKKDFIIYKFLDPAQVEQIYTMINSKENVNGDTENKETNYDDDKSSIIKKILKSIVLTFKDIFLKPLLFIVFLLLALLILKYIENI